MRIRNIRRDALDKFKAAQKKSEITEDELHDGEDKMQKLTDKYVKEVDAMVAKEIEGTRRSLIQGEVRCLQRHENRIFAENP